MRKVGPARLRYYFSFRSPYSWLTHRELVQSHGDIAAAVEWVPFWEPDTLSTRMLREAGGKFVYATMSREKHFYVLQDTRRLAAERDLSFTWPRDRESCWEVPHLAYLVAAAAGRAADFADRLYHSRWQEGLDICDRRVVADVAAGLGLDSERVANAVDEPSVRELGVSALLAAYEDRVFGVPFFVRGFDQYWGLDRLGIFVEAVRTSKPDQADAAESPMLTAVVASDGGHAGGCG